MNTELAAAGGELRLKVLKPAASKAVAERPPPVIGLLVQQAGPEYLVQPQRQGIAAIRPTLPHGHAARRTVSSLPHLFPSLSAAQVPGIETAWFPFAQLISAELLRDRCLSLVASGASMRPAWRRAE